MKLPLSRGDLSHAIFTALRNEGPLPHLLPRSTDEDRQVALWTLYELHYRGFDDVSDQAEWDPAVLATRRLLEEPFEVELRDLTAGLLAKARAEDSLLAGLECIVAEPGPSIATYMHRDATRDQYEEFLAVRSLYHLKESDPHAWAMPRLAGAAKAALAEIQYDEFGGGDPAMVHQTLYAEALGSVGLDTSYGAYVDDVPAHTLAVNNAMSLFGLHRRHRGACMGHLAAFEMTSSLPCRRMAQGAERLGMPAAVFRYFDEHVEADAVHEQLASRSLCVPLVAAEPELHDDVLFGAAACVLLDAAAAEKTLAGWTRETDAVA
jgi:hypothetical protein